jgi:hypothetical protein
MLEFRTSGDNSTFDTKVFCHDILIREFIQIYAHSCPILRCYKCNMRPYNNCKTDILVFVYVQTFERRTKQRLGCDQLYSLHIFY